jgi:ABC-type phosphate/phosphonate transport system substrate-binding protein
MSSSENDVDMHGWNADANEEQKRVFREAELIRISKANYRAAVIASSSLSPELKKAFIESIEHDFPGHLYLAGK